jgi:RNA polymerase sigma-70 factor (ECF subfamily)
VRLFHRSKPDIEGIYQRHADVMYRVALAKLCSDADAQDAVQDVFVNFLSTAPVFESEAHERAWFLRATTNRCYDLMRRNQVRQALPLEEALGVAAQDNSGVTELMELLQLIPEIYKDTVILHCLEGHSLEETADLLGISLSAAKMRLSRAREALRALREED